MDREKWNLYFMIHVVIPKLSSVTELQVLYRYFHLLLQERYIQYIQPQILHVLYVTEWQLRNHIN
jgi:hypothetical protein